MRVLEALSTAAKDEAELVQEIFATDGGDEAVAAKRDEIARFLDELGKLELVEPDRGGAA
jgi:hypothetical protein